MCNGPDLFDAAGFLIALVAFWFVIVQIVYQKRRTDTDLINKVIEAVRQTQHHAFARISGTPADAQTVFMLAETTLDLIRLEMTHRRQDVQTLMVSLTKRYLVLADFADGRGSMTVAEIGEHAGDLVTDLIALIRDLTFFEALKQVYAIPGDQLQLPKFNPVERVGRKEPQL